MGRADDAARLALNRRLEALHVRAQRLARTRWARNLRVELSKPESSLTLSYWMCVVDDRTSLTLQCSATSCARGAGTCSGTARAEASVQAPAQHRVSEDDRRRRVDSAWPDALRRRTCD